jgi:hypothetical protein
MLKHLRTNNGTGPRKSLVNETDGTRGVFLTGDADQGSWNYVRRRSPCWYVRVLHPVMVRDRWIARPSVIWAKSDVSRPSSNLLDALILFVFLFNDKGLRTFFIPLSKKERD